MTNDDVKLLRRGLVLVAREVVQEAQHLDATPEEAAQADLTLSQLIELGDRLDVELLA